MQNIDKTSFLLKHGSIHPYWLLPSYVKIQNTLENFDNLKLNWYQKFEQNLLITINEVK